MAKFVQNKGAHSYTESCDSIEGFTKIDSSIAKVTTVMFWFILSNLTYTFAKILVPGGDEDTNSKPSEQTFVGGSVSSSSSSSSTPPSTSIEMLGMETKNPILSNHHEEGLESQRGNSANEDGASGAEDTPMPTSPSFYSKKIKLSSYRQYLSINIFAYNLLLRWLKIIGSACKSKAEADEVAVEIKPYEIDDSLKV